VRDAEHLLRGLPAVVAVELELGEHADDPEEPGDQQRLQREQLPGEAPAVNGTNGRVSRGTPPLILSAA
jgi:hypothetical protein